MVGRTGGRAVVPSTQFGGGFGRGNPARALIQQNLILKEARRAVSKDGPGENWASPLILRDAAFAAPQHEVIWRAATRSTIRYSGMPMRRRAATQSSKTLTSLCCEAKPSQTDTLDNAGLTSTALVICSRPSSSRPVKARATAMCQRAPRLIERRDFRAVEHLLVHRNGGIRIAGQQVGIGKEKRNTRR